MTMAAMDKQDVSNALNERNVRVASLIIEGFRHWTDMLDEQPPEILLIILEHARELQRPGGAPVHRYALRAEAIKYVEAALTAARAREERLCRAITGEEPPG
jgi:hypothetical protein